MDNSVAGVMSARDDSTSVCLIDENCFEPPPGYIRLGSEEFRHLSIENDDDLLQLAIQQSLLEAGSEEEQVTIWEALRAHRPLPEDKDLQRVFHYSMTDYQNCNSSGIVSNFGHHVQQSARDSQLSLALQLSHQAALEEDNKRKEEEEQLARVIQLSLSQK